MFQTTRYYPLFPLSESSGGRFSILKVYNASKIQNFKKIKPDCTTVFFNVDGRPNVWYGKNKNGKLEFFNALFQHPETGKTLKEITPYIINKYVCDTF